jgi:two-component system sensor kinase FixL
LQRRQDELVHVARLSTMGEMSTGIAHELNQPLSAISNFANGCVRRLNSDVGTKEDLVKALEQIAAQSKRAAEIIKRLRALVTKQQTIRQHINLNEVVDEVCELVAHDIRKDKISLEKKLIDQPLWVDVDTVQIEQVLINLVRNAIDAMQVRVQSERRLLIETSFTEDDRAQIRIKDDGAGIPEEQLIKLFDAFYTTKEHGMGMGLAITKTIVEEHSGKIYASSKVGKGSTFYVELPLSLDNKLDEE